MDFLKANFKSLIITFSVIITGYILGNSYLSKGKADPKITNQIISEKLDA